ncbi:MAG: DUF5119 domain-containing protein [Duncaniella sp.]|nr:DUF5119 domain-containing protein [Duncaniella sp.]
MMKNIKISLAAVLALSLTGCHHKELCYDHIHRVDIDVVFDWQNAPDATAKSMALYMYDTETDEHLRYIFDNNEGGPISIPFGKYNGLCLNSDDTDWAIIRNEHDIEKFEIYTADAEALETTGLSTRTMPRARATEEERVAKTPGMLWSDRQDAIDLPVTTTHKTITFYPDEDICHYTVDIYDVEHITSIEGSALDGTISGMAEGYYHGKKQPTENVVTMPFILTLDETDKSLHSEFLTFGECSGEKHDHTLTIYMYLDDGSKKYYNFDVTDQVADAPDPHNVHIIIHGLSIPNPLSDTGGFIPEVDDWEAVYINLNMNPR